VERLRKIQRPDRQD